MITTRDKKQMGKHLEKAQLLLQPFCEDTEELQYLWQAIIHVQIALEGIEVEDELRWKGIISRNTRVLGS